MLAVLSPAKKLDFSPHAPPLPVSSMALEADARTLLRTARARSRSQLKSLMHLSDDLADLNWQRFQQMDGTFDEGNALQAALAFAGDTYLGLDARTLSADDLQWGQDHLLILSGLYGVLRPLDLIQPYRLEMGTRLKTRRGSNLYAFWGDRLAKRINQQTLGHADRTVVSLASAEYFKAARPKKLAGPVVDVKFLEIKPDKVQMISFLAKKARGRMARWMLIERVERAEQLRHFSEDGYTYQADQSTDTTLVFSRTFVPVAQRR